MYIHALSVRERVPKSYSSVTMISLSHPHCLLSIWYTLSLDSNKMKKDLDKVWYCNIVKHFFLLISDYHLSMAFNLAQHSQSVVGVFFNIHFLNTKMSHPSFTTELDRIQLFLFLKALPVIPMPIQAWEPHVQGDPGQLFHPYRLSDPRFLFFHTRVWVQWVMTLRFHWQRLAFCLSLSFLSFPSRKSWQPD